MAKAIVMTSSDNVATALSDIPKGTDVTLIDKSGKELPSIRTQETIPAGNKFALYLLPEGTPLIKYGIECGTITTRISQGHFVHVHNVKSDRIDIPAPIIQEILEQMHYREGE